MDMHTVLIVAVAVVVSVVGTYLFLRNNPKKRAEIDKTVDEWKNG